MFTFQGLSTAQAHHLQSGGKDIHGQPAEKALTDGHNSPCRHCLSNVPAGEMLIAAHRPFETLQPYAEAGPIFLCSDPCDAFKGASLPEVLTLSPTYLVKGYTADERIKYGTGAIVAQDDLETYIGTLFEQPDIAFVDIRSARNNCWLARARRETS